VRIQHLKFLFPILLFSSCIVQSPKYTSLEQVMSLHTGMTKTEVEESLKLKPYDLKAVTDSGTTLIYIYRVIDRRTLSFDTKPDNGRKSTGKYVQLQVTYSKENKVVNIESCNTCPDNLVTKSRVDIEKVIAFITVTLPVLLVYFGLQSN
jgi:hypothetical protein